MKKKLISMAATIAVILILSLLILVPKVGLTIFGMIKLMTAKGMDGCA